MVTLTQLPHIPTEEETQVSKESSRILAAHISRNNHQLKIVEEDGTEQTAVIPESAYRLLVDILTHMAQGYAVTLMPIHAELTTQQAADLLNVSRPHIIKLMETGHIPYFRVGRHRRVLFKDLMAYKDNIDAQRIQVLEQLVAESEALGFYD